MPRALVPVIVAVLVGQALLFVFPALMGAGLAATMAAVAATVVLAALALLVFGGGDAALAKEMLAVVTKIERNETPQPVQTTRTDDMGELAAAINRLTNRDKAVEQANTDALTGLANRRGLNQKLAYAFKRNQPLALFYIDLDKFKPINDTYGHEMGDAVLKRVAELFLANVRENDVVARIGGDEFVLLMFDLTDRKLLEDRAEKILTAISEPMWVNDVRVKIGGSIGITVAPTDGESPEALMAAADETMYAVKKAGRNNWKFYS
ncbi:MAG: GGDEF domain-containing protein [Pseudomonadaceae bacterium]|nr:GGDEF domain-containing protein [Pseudomonadaceae bacterium]